MKAPKKKTRRAMWRVFVFALNGPGGGGPVVEVKSPFGT